MRHFLKALSVFTLVSGILLNHWLVLRCKGPGLVLHFLVFNLLSVQQLVEVLDQLVILALSFSSRHIARI